MRIAPGGFLATIAALAVGALAAAVGLWPVALGAGMAAAAILGFYRDPERTPAGAGPVVPADGRVTAVRETDSGRVQVTIFLNVWNVHVVRSPAGGRVGRLERVDGHRRPAFLESAADNAGIALDMDGWTVTMRAGLVARRVRPYVAVSDALERGQRIGHIAFGSRVDVFAPPTVPTAAIDVAEGDRVRAGRTVLVTPEGASPTAMSDPEEP